MGQNFARRFQAHAIDNGSGVQLNSTYLYRTSGSSELLVTKTITVTEDSSEVRFEFEFASRGDIKIDGVEFQFADVAEPFGVRGFNYFTDDVVNRSYVTYIIKNNNMVGITRKEFDKSEISAELVFSPTPSQISYPEQSPVYAGKVYLEVNYLVEKQTHFKLRMGTSPLAQDRFRNGLQIYKLLDLMEAYNVGYLVLDRTNVKAQEVYTYYGFPKVYDNRSYVVYRVLRK